jgi:protein-L-isoaspartate(D-aspartate) O-methyltransferase
VNGDPRGIGMTSERTRARLVERLRAAGIRHPAVLEAMRDTPRHLFVEEALAHRAYEDSALPIGYGQTISQPYTVARMTEALLAPGVETGAPGTAPLRGDTGYRPARVLEIGTGCGYQTAILARLCAAVFTVERIEPLMRQARRHIHRSRLTHVRFRLGDGHDGWPEHAPYDRILVAAVAEEIPPALLEQLAPGGRLVLPVANEAGQELRCIERTDKGFINEHLEAANFVPLIRTEPQAAAKPGAARR